MRNPFARRCFSDELAAAALAAAAKAEIEKTAAEIEHFTEAVRDKCRIHYLEMALAEVDPNHPALLSSTRNVAAVDNGSSL